MKIQYWKNGVMMGLVSAEDAEKIKQYAKENGYIVKDGGHYFTVDLPDNPF